MSADGLPVPEPALTDDVIALRPWTPRDAAALAAAWADPEVRRWTAVPDRATAADAARWIAGWDERCRRGLALDLVVCPLGEPDAVAGEVGIVRHAQGVEVGWWMAREFRGRGWGTRAVTLLAAWCRESLGVEPVAAVDEANVASVRIADHAALRRIPEG